MRISRPAYGRLVLAVAEATADLRDHTRTCPSCRRAKRSGDPLCSAGAHLQDLLEGHQRTQAAAEQLRDPQLKV